ncbi:phage tail protein [Sphingomonas sanxanigenens]|nr:phage tail protein [Sphingomonas sanxanigenens]
MSTIATIASAVATAASIAAQLTAKKPGAQGTTTNITISANGPIPYGMGRSFFAGSQLHDVGYGGKVNGVKNPYRALVLLWSATTAQELESFLLDWQPVSFAGTAAIGYYASFLYLSKQVGQRPEPAALTGQWGGVPGWSAAHKLSGYAAGLVSMRFDKKGKRWASGVPPMGMVGKWAKVYDPRKDGTFPGGSGAHRWGDEDTFEYDDDVGLNALTYARGRFARNGKQVVGCGFPQDAIDWPSWLAWINVCQANGWKVGGTVLDGPGMSRWDNLKRICQAGAAVPCFSGGKLAVRFQAPKVALDTITSADLADGEPIAPAMRTYRDRINTIVPKYRSEQNKWELVQSKAITDEGYIAIDQGEPKEEEVTYELVTDKDQAAQLGAYELVGRREISGITLPCKPRLWEYKLGEVLQAVIPELALNHLCTIVALSKDVGTGIVTLTLETETNAKHPFALGQTGTAPPAPTLTPHGDNDDVIWNNDGNEVDNPIAGEWNATTSVQDISGSLRQVVRVEGEPTDPNVAVVTFEYRQAGAGAWTIAATLPAGEDMRYDIGGLDPNVTYDVAVRYRGSGSGAEDTPRFVIDVVTFPTVLTNEAGATLLADDDAVLEID